MRRIRRHLTYSNVVATLALFIVLTGGTAVALNGSNTVFSDDIVDDQVRSVDVRDDTLSSGGLAAVDLRPNSVHGSEVLNGSLTAADFSGSLPASTVVVRARGSSSVSTGNGGPNSPVSYPLSNNSWTQAANESDLFHAQISFNAPSVCDGDVGGFLRILVDGQLVFNTTFFDDDSTPGLTNTTTFGLSSRLLFEPGSANPRTLTASIADDCAQAGQNFVVTSLKVNGIGFR